MTKIAAINGTEYVNLETGRLFSESGPSSVLGSNEPLMHPILMVSQFCEFGKVKIAATNSVIAMGKVPGYDYNEFADVCMPKEDMERDHSNSEGIIFCQHDLKDGDVVVLATSSNRVLPGLIVSLGRRLGVQPVLPIEKGERAFIFTEEGHLATVSYVFTGAEQTGIVPRIAFASWVYATNPYTQPRKYIVFRGTPDDQSFIIHSEENKDFAYVGRLSGAMPAKEEVDNIINALALHGLGGIVSNYVLKKIKA